MIKKKVNFPENFILGAAGSAWQLEGWGGKDKNSRHYMDGWYMATPELWHDGVGPTIAADFYHRYKEDAKLMKEVGLNAFRTSIDWSRLIKNYETGEVDEKAVEYYNNVIDEIKSNGVEPMLCLEHYELPMELFNKHGGWGSKHVIDCYVKYAEKAFELFGHKVKYWFTFNEPIVVQTRVYLDAIRWPFEQNTKLWMQWNYNKILATAKVVELYNKNQYGKAIGGKIGVILNPEVTYPRSSAAHDVKAAEMYDLYFNRIYMDPHLKGEFPEELMKDLKKHDCIFDYTEEELEIIKNNTVKFVGMNLYYPHRIKARNNAWNPDVPFHPSYHYDLFDLPGKKMNPYRGWEIYPKIIYDMGMRLKNEYDNVEWIVAESGMGVQNEKQYKNEEGIIQDDYRIEYISEHLYWTLKAIEDGSNCSGYMLWAFMDNVSPQNSFKNRYGLVGLDLENNRSRSIKKSGYWYKELQEKRALEIELKEYEFETYRF
jgi:6-phospho-beta-glucosidase